VLIRASQIYFKTHLEHIRQTDPIQMNLHFPQLIPPVVLHVEFEDLKLKKRHSTIQAKITSPRVINATRCILTIFTMSDLSIKLGIHMELPPILTPDREREYARWANALF
jgi:hypothetical protein